MTTAIILAGGLGTRLRAAVPDLPKPMAPIRGRPFLEYQLDYWIGQGVERFVLSVGYRHEAIVAHFGDSYHGVPLSHSIESTPLGTGGGLLFALDRVAGPLPFLLLNGDTYFEADLGALHRFHAAKQSEWTFSLFRSPQDGRYMGMGVDDSGRIMTLKSGLAGAGNGPTEAPTWSIRPCCAAVRGRQAEGFRSKTTYCRPPSNPDAACTASNAPGPSSTSGFPKTTCGHRAC